ncbi:hypothetical protein VPH35_024504 [Triticum aestivum]
MAQGVAAGGGSSTAPGAGASTAVDGDPGTADGSQGGAGDGSSVRSAAGGHGAAMQHLPMSSAVGAGHGDVAGGAGHGDAARLGLDAGLGHGAAADLEGMDPSSCYVLKIRLLGNPKKARKEPMCFYFEKVIDSDLTNYEDLVESIIVQYQPRYLEVAHVHYYDEVLKTFPEIKSDQELMYMFEKHAKSKMPIIEYYSDVHIQPKNNIDQDDDSYLRNPIPENEHVGIDEENMYLKEEPKALNMTMLLMVRVRMRVRMGVRMRVRMRARTRLSRGG